MAEWLTLASTLVLVIVTGWYAWLTKSLASSAKTSADSARDAAEHAAKSVAVAEASVDVRFECVPSSGPLPDHKSIGVFLWCRGATVYVHGVSMHELTRRLESSANEIRSEIVFWTRDGEHAVSTDSKAQLPALVHAGEKLDFITRADDFSPGFRLGPEDRIDSIVIQVQYSFDGVGPVRQREVSWRMPRKNRSLHPLEDSMP
ncbi:hypothetical protein [Agromyces sp. NDB4Y10]|uniref:hypothetical protein n=1 Tax=Agromyces sp. NDB4Y10 TaxID=1775951 RepID=UPI0008321E11|nr:hypothetical protein [Agromyces sp. NDB4Y10]